MPIIKSAKKAMKQNKKLRVKNQNQKKSLKNALKEAQRLATAGNAAEVVKQLPSLYKMIDKAAKRRVIHKNNAARKKSALARLAAKK